MPDRFAKKPDLGFVSVRWARLHWDVVILIVIRLGWQFVWHSVSFRWAWLEFVFWKNRNEIISLFLGSAGSGALSFLGIDLKQDEEIVKSTNWAALLEKIPGASEFCGAGFGSILRNFELAGCGVRVGLDDFGSQDIEVTTKLRFEGELGERRRSLSEDEEAEIDRSFWIWYFGPLLAWKRTVCYNSRIINQLQSNINMIRPNNFPFQRNKRLFIDLRYFLEVFFYLEVFQICYLKFSWELRPYLIPIKAYRFHWGSIGRRRPEAFLFDKFFSAKDPSSLGSDLFWANHLLADLARDSSTLYCVVSAMEDNFNSNWALTSLLFSPCARIWHFGGYREVRGVPLR